MVIELKCSGCACRLQVPDEHLDKMVRCPKCDAMTKAVAEGRSGDQGPADRAAATDSDQDTADAAASSGEEAKAATPPRDEMEDWTWHLRTPDGREFGPILTEVLDDWVSEGRVTSSCRLRRERTATWQPSEDIYPLLAARKTSTPHLAKLDVEVPSMGEQEFMVAHRGWLVLTLGILGWIITCPILSVAAWMMGTSDLRDMRQRRMDPSGFGATQAGQVIGMIYTVIWLVVLLVLMFVLLYAIFTGRIR